MQELEIINILKENDLSDVEVLKNEEEYVLVNFYFDFDIIIDLKIFNVNSMKQLRHWHFELRPEN